MCIARDLGHLQRHGIRQSHVTVEARDEDRILRRDRIDQLPGGKRRRIPERVIPLAAGDPFSGSNAFGVFADAARELLRSLRVAQLHARELHAAIDEMRVIVDEARGGEPPVEVDDARACWCDPGDIGRRSDCRDPIPFDGHRLGPRPRRIAGPDLSIREYHGRQNCGEHSARNSIGLS